jgi:hypothetical protein
MVVGNVVVVLGIVGMEMFLFLQKLKMNNQAHILTVALEVHLEVIEKLLEQVI